MALLLLAAAARHGAVKALSVDHGLRPEAAHEVGLVAALCDRLGVPHRALQLSLSDGADLQARAREARYAAMAGAAFEDGIATLATAHHADDQAETILMRLSRGSGVAGLAGIRPSQEIAGIRIVRPLLAWTKNDLEQVCRSANVAWADDPSNADPRFARASVRSALRTLDLDPHLLSMSASAAREADEALDWAAETLAGRVGQEGDAWLLDPRGLPFELVRRLLLKTMEQCDARPRGPDLRRAIERALHGKKSTLCGLLLEPLPGGRWRIGREPPRRG